MATDCIIRFENSPQSVFYGGQLLSGCVELTTRKEKSIRAIYITIEGYASVKWRESRSRKEGDRTVHYTVTYSGHEQYLSSRTYVAGSEGASGFDLNPGNYSYNFQVALPHQIPSSFEGEYGHIRYQVVVTIDRPWRFDNVFKRPFTVISSLDLNLNPQYKMPIYLEDSKTFCCFCCESGPVTAKVNIPLSGYAPGQKLPFVILVDNESTTDCRNVRVKLERVATFKSQTPERDMRTETTRLVEKNLGSVLKLCKKELKNCIELPSIPPSSLNTCSIIDISYWFYVVIHTPKCHSNLEFVCPITIGTVPLYESATNPANVITMQPTAPQLSDEGSGDNPPGYNSFIPPSYEEAMFMGGKAFVDEDGDKHAKVEPFVPKYPVYYNFATAPSIDQPVDTNHQAGSSDVDYGWKS